MFVTERSVGGNIHRGVLMPAKGLQRLTDETLSLVAIEPALALSSGNQFPRTGGKDISRGEDVAGLLAQCIAFDQLKPQQRGEDPEWVVLERSVRNRPKRRG